MPNVGSINFLQDEEVTYERNKFFFKGYVTETIKKAMYKRLNNIIVTFVSWISTSASLGHLTTAVALLVIAPMHLYLEPLGKMTVSETAINLSCTDADGDALIKRGIFHEFHFLYSDI